MTTDTDGGDDIDEIARRAQGGDAAAAVRLDEKIKPRGKEIAKRRGIPPVDADAIINQAFAEALATWSPDGKASFKTYFSVIMDRRSVDHLRRLIKEKKLIEKQKDLEAISDDRKGPDAAAEYKDDVVAARECIEQLSYADRLILAKRHPILADWEMIPEDAAADVILGELTKLGDREYRWALFKVMKGLRQCVADKIS